MTTVLIAALATWQIVEIWRHSQLTAGSRAAIETRSDMVAGWLSCPFCLSPWVALFCFAGLTLTQGIWFVGDVFTMVISSLATSRLANLGNDLTYSWNRTPKVLAGLQAIATEDEEQKDHDHNSGTVDDPDIVEE
jgi:hypothetical protein